MSRTLTPPMARIPIGTVVINGQVLEVKQHPEFSRFFFDLFARVGGTAGTGNADLLDMIGTLPGDPVAEEAGSLAREALGLIQTRPAQQPSIAPDPDLSSDVQSLRAELDSLRQAVAGLQQGYQV